MGKDIKQKQYNLNNIDWHQIKGGITKESLCKGNKDLENIFDAIDTDGVKGRLSHNELLAFADKIQELAGDDTLDKKEAHKFKNINGKKVKSESVFSFLKELENLEDKRIKATYTTTSDGREVERTEYKSDYLLSSEDESLDGTYYSTTEGHGSYKVKEEYENNQLIRKTTKLQDTTQIEDFQNKTITTIRELGKGLTEQTIKEDLGENHTRTTFIAYDGAKTVKDIEKFDELTKTTTTAPDGTKRIDYTGKLYITGPSHYYDLQTVDNYIAGKCDEDIYLGKEIIRTITNSKMDKDSQKEYIKNIINQTLKLARISYEFSENDILEELNSFMKDEVTDISKLENLYADMLIHAEKIRESGLNGLIDRDFKQGDVGDCYLLAAIKSMACHDKSKGYLENIIKLDNNGNVHVTLKGVNKTFIVTQDELDTYDYSYGDRDVRALEIAVDKYMKKYGDPYEHKDFDIDGGYSKWAYFLLTGKHSLEHIGTITSDSITKLQSGNYIGTVSIRNDYKDEVGYKTPSGEKDTALTYHEYAICSIDSDYVYLANPHDTSITIPIAIEEFKKTFNHITLLPLVEEQLSFSNS